MSYRGIFAYEDEEEPWKSALDQFENKTPSFPNKIECEKFIRKYSIYPSNPKYLHFKHIFSLISTWEDIEEIILTYRDRYNATLLPKKYSINMLLNNKLYNNSNNKNRINLNKIKNRKILELNNILLNINKINLNNISENILNYNELSYCLLNEIKKRMKLPIYSIITNKSILNTFQYLFYHLRCGIYIKIRSNKLVLFVPFANENYENSWYNILDVGYNNETDEQYFQRKISNTNKYEKPLNRKNWWANGNIMCVWHKYYKDQFSQLWGDHFLASLKDMLIELCRLKEIGDCEFFLNKRDYPQLKINKNGIPVEPYGFIYNKDDRKYEDDVELKQYKYNSYAPIVSFYISNRFADLPWPTSEDWEAATGLVYPPTFNIKQNQKEIKIRDLFTSENFKNFDCLWEDKVNTAFFRGGATGGGVTIETNQRLHIASISYEWNNNNNNNNNNNDNDIPLLDAKITGWNQRDKKISSSSMTFINPDDFPFIGNKSNFVPIYQQSRYKYLVYIEGHCAACRYSFMMRLGSVILKVESKCVADEIWYFPLLQPYIDHIPIKSDLSDLKEKIEWCRNNDDKCKIIAENAKELYNKFISKDGILDYLQCVVNSISKQSINLPYWVTQNIKNKINKPLLPKTMSGCFNRMERTKNGMCKWCTMDLERKFQLNQNDLSDDDLDDDLDDDNEIKNDNNIKKMNKKRSRSISEDNNNNENNENKRPIKKSKREMLRERMLKKAQEKKNKKNI